MFNKILIANRGEIAVRIIRACREMGIRTVAVYSEADRDALHTQLADEAVCIGKAQSSDSYLNMERILSATIATKAEAIHPGFGFLSENSRFVEMCEKCNVAFIGPSAEVISRMGNKSEAKNTMRKAKVPVVPGTKEPVYTVEQALEGRRSLLKVKLKQQELKRMLKQKQIRKLLSLLLQSLLRNRKLINGMVMCRRCKVEMQQQLLTQET